MLYLAYGSNLSRARMAQRCPAARPLRPVSLSGWALRFERVATIAPVAGARLAGALYRLTAECERTLDRVEGVAEGRYRRVQVTVPDPASPSGNDLALTYIKIDGRCGPPTTDYLAHIVAGFRDWELDDALLHAALRAVR